MIFRINPSNPQKRLIDKAVNILKEGGIIAYPTDTIYGFGCDMYNKKAIQRIYQIKKRDPKKPFSFICSDLKNISLYAQVTNQAYKIMKRCLPGPYTFILLGTKLVPKIMVTKRKTVGIRVPDNNICLSLVKTLGNPIISTSVGFSGGEVFSDSSLIEETFGSQIDLTIDGGIPANQPSTIISLIDDQIEVIREGLGEFRQFL
ncbi:MAG: threonylcarbamoyl-AMP synthase [Deltaproteobacteria bacterium RBG_13_43_22]|nr:MAG: threonylcarbamoyl-AMP synthase [Deltaproteobacteria bacterium RBG_13_43_22]